MKAWTTHKTIWLNQQYFGWFNHRIYLLFGQENFWLIQQNIWLIQPNCLIVLIKLEYLVNSTKKFFWFNQIFMDTQQKSFVGSRNIFFLREHIII